MSSRILTPSDRDLALARDEFRHRLSVATREADWQRFFTSHPYVLSLSLPLRLEPADIVPLGRPGRSEPDFLLYPHNTHPIPYYGVIELKRPDSTVVSQTRTNLIVLSRDAETAVQQAVQYSRTPELYDPALLSGTPVLLGNPSHLFVIMGTSSELSRKLATDVHREMVTQRLPDNLQLIPYDSLLSMFEAHVPARVHLLVPDVASPVEAKIDLLRRISEMWEIVYSVAAKVGQSGAFARSSHGYRPEWLIRTWLPDPYRDVDTLRDRIASGLQDEPVGELEELAHALGVAVVQARDRNL